MFRANLFSQWVTVCGYLGLYVFGVCVNMIFYYLVVFWSGVRGYGAVLTGVALLPETFSLPLSAILCGLAMRKTGRLDWPMFVGWPLASASIGLLWFLDAHTPIPILILINIGVGLGAGTVSPALQLIILRTTNPRDNGHSMAMGWLFRSAGMCLGIAIGTAVFTVQMDNHLSRLNVPKTTGETFLRALMDGMDNSAGRQVIVDTLRILWMICCALSGVAGILCCSCKYPRLERTGSSSINEGS